MNVDWKKVSTFLKKNAVSVAAVVVGLASIAVVLFYLDGEFAQVKSDVEARAAVAGELQAVRTKSRPTINIEQGGRREGDEQLPGFPTKATIERGQAVMNAVRSASGQVLAQAVDNNRRTPLLFDDYDQATQVWPLSGEGDRFRRDQWLRRYREYLNVAGIFDEEAGNFPASSLAGELEATRPPDAESIALAQERRQQAIEAESVTDQATGEFMDPEGVEERISKELGEVERGLMFNRANDHKLYLSPEAILPHPVAEVQQRPAEDDVFQAQYKLWVQEAVLENLYITNLDALESLPESDRNVTNAPVKHVVALDVPDVFPSGRVSAGAGGVGGGAVGGGGGGGFGADPYGGGDPYGGYGGYGGDEFGGGMMGDPYGGMGDPSGGMGGAVPTDPAAGGATTTTEVPVDNAVELQRDYSISPSGREQHNPLFDAVQFTLVVRVEAARLPEVLRQLQQGSLVTVLNLNSLRQVDPLVALANGYIYGNAAVVEVEITGEVLMLREWTVPLMPEGIKARLAGIGADPAAVAG